MSEHELWYRSPARSFTEALPLGNGRLGAMAFGGLTIDRFELNDDTAWSGSPASEHAQGAAGPDAAAAALARARSLIAAGQHEAAEAELATLAQRYTQAYLPFAAMELRVGSAQGRPDPDPGPGADDVPGYRRALDLDSAVHSVEHAGDRRRSLVSAVHGVLAVEATFARPTDVALVLDSPLDVIGVDGSGIRLRMPSNVAPTHADEDDPIAYDDALGSSLHGAVAVGWIHDGQETEPADGAVRAARGVSRMELFVATGTTFTGIGRPPAGSADDARARALASVERALSTGFGDVLAQHVVDHRHYYRRAELEIDGHRSDLPTDRRLVAALEHPDGPMAADPRLASLLFHYGRYLLIASSRPDSLPATLQGIWNDRMPAPWSSNYTININTQMNYWGVEVANLGELHLPLVDLVEALARAGTSTARRLYDAPGWVAHHNSDAWAFTSPVAGDAAWSFWPMGGVWLVRHLWEHLRFGADDAFRDRIRPVVRGATEFALALLVDQPDGTLGTSPSTSPENHFVTRDGIVAAAARSSTSDVAAIRDLLEIAARLLEPHDPLLVEIAAAAARLPSIPIAADGSVQEWADPFDEHEPHHRHLSHLYFAYPGEQSLDHDLARAVTATLDTRGDDSTGWSLVWKMLVQARLRRGDRVSDLLRLYFRRAESVDGPFAGGLYRNMFAAHPPFQLDGNLGFVAAVAECLVQSHENEIVLAPAVPAEWSSGRVRGLRARPGVDVSFSWSTHADGSVTVETEEQIR